MTASPPSTDSAPPTSPALLALLGGALAAFLLTLLNRYLGVWVPLPAAQSVAGHLASLAYLFPLLLALMGAAGGAARLPQSPGFLGLVGLLLAVPMGMVYLLTEKFRVPVPLPLFLTANNLFLPVGVILMGVALGRKIIKHPNTLLALAGIVIFFDIVMVTMGTVAQAMQANSKLISLVSVGGGSPQPQMPLHLSKSIPLLSGVTIGPADVLLPALFFAAIVQFPRLKPEWQIPLKRTFWWVFGLLALALVVVEVTALPIPAWVPMGMGLLIANSRYAAFSKQEKRDLWIGAVFAIFCAALIIAGAKRFFASQPKEPVSNQRVPKWGWQVGVVRETGERFVTGVLDGMPIAKAGIKPGDVIESINSINTSTLTRNEDWFKALDDAEKMGLVVRLRRLGEKKPLDVKVTLP
ncbi:PDZ domain-containing protein [Armatimonas sp.]|uniref:PDZ domain-containing protein n=1 Tax=Armatimonas sp. TaxID=1872638 RepID=UPI00286AF128|nr:PDZ domain-containing protein [Armatimonas sp.]